MKKMLKCDDCGWVGEHRDMRQVTKTKDGVWGCPRCGHIFFTYVYYTKDVAEDNN